MSLISVLSCIYLVFMFYLYIKKKDFGNAYIIFGVITFLGVMSYCSVPNVQEFMQRFIIFISFSCYILNFGLMIGLMLFIKSKNMKKSIIFSIISSLVMITFMFNIRGFFEYMYIPVLLYMLQRKINEFIN